MGYNYAPRDVRWYVCNQWKERESQETMKNNQMQILQLKNKVPDGKVFTRWL